MAAHPVADVICALDGSRTVWPASHLMRAVRTGRDPAPAQARLAHQFVGLNRRVLDAWDIDARVITENSGGVGVEMRVGSQIGALPLASPVTGRIEHGLVIGPRFGWQGVGSLLADTGAKVQPALPKLPSLPRNATGVPPWVIAAVVVARIEAMLDRTSKRFNERQSLEDRPRGSVEWSIYVRDHVSRGRPERVPCRYSYLSDDLKWLGAAHATALKQRQSLSRLRTDAHVVRPLLRRFEEIRRRVAHVPPRWDVLGHQAQDWMSRTAVEALEAFAWTHDERGLGGEAPNAGLAWRLSMPETFEAWLEDLIQRAARRHGGVVRSGRRRQTLRALRWQPPYTGSQRYLLPDVEWETSAGLFVFDAKYKAHWEEIEGQGWFGVRNEIRDAHRADLLQVLAYAAASTASNVTGVLFYPCHRHTWRSLVTRQRAFHVAEVPAGARTLRLVLAAAPIGGDLDDVAKTLVQALMGVSE